MYANIFSPITVGGIELKNRLTMAPLYLGYAGEGGTVTEALIEHYRLMAQSEVALVVVENATVSHPEGSGSDYTIRADTDDNMAGLSRLAETIKQEGALASLQINHAGRFAAVPEPCAPSIIETFGRFTRGLIGSEILQIVKKYVDAAKRAKNAGFDMVELHGGTGYLLAQFVSPKTNSRGDSYGGKRENRWKFPLEVLAAVKDAVGDFPVGYRFLADEWLPPDVTSLRLDESCQFAKTLSGAGAAYISVMGGTYESFFLPEIVERSKKEGYMVYLAEAVKKQVDVPIITAGRIASGAFADKVIADGKADLIGLARVLWADPQWPQKVKEGREQDIVHCDPDCGDACMQMVMKKKPAICVNWPADKMKAWKAKFH